MKNRFFPALLTVSALLIILSCKKKEVDSAPVTPVDVLSSVLTPNLSYPWEILWGPDNFIWMTEKGGKISRVDTGTGTVTLLHTITEVVSNGEGGLLGMVLHPQFNTTPQVFVTYNYMNGANYREK